MKHLIKRDDFLRKTKAKESKTDILMEIAISKTPELIRESVNSGPFSNEVAWNDSLLGRLVNHIFRKAKIALNMVRIQPVIMRLKSEFNNLVAEGYLASADDDLKIEIFRLKVSELLWIIQNTIKSKGEVRYLKQLVAELIKLFDNFPEIEGMDVLEKEMKDFSDFIGQFEDEEDEEKDEEDEIEDEEEEEEEEIDAEGEVIISLIRENLTALKTISTEIATFQSTGTGLPNPVGTGQKQNSSYSFNEAITSKDPQVNTALTRLKDTFATTVGSKVDANKIQNLIDLLDNSHYELVNVYREVKRYLKGDKQGLLNDFRGKLGKLYEADATTSVNFIDALAIEISKFHIRTSQFDDAFVTKVPNPIGSAIKKFNDTIERMFTLEFDKAFPGLAKWKQKMQATGRKLESKLIASYEDFINETMLSRAIGKGAAKVAKLFKGKGKEGDEEKEVDQAPQNPSGAQSDQGQSDDEQGNQGTQSASNDSQRDGEPSDPETGSVWEKIRLFWESKCKSTSRFILDRTESDKIRDNVENLKEGGRFCINGMDPVIQIARLFNRAYKIYTTNTITRRSDGKVDARTWEEYDSFGGSSGSINGWNGPFRNKKIFNIWENAVMKIIADRKYEFVFSSKTALRMPKVSNPKKDSDFEMREGAGAKLRNYILDMLDGDELYKSGSDRGAQAKFLEKYFGKIDETKTEPLTITEKEGKENQEMADKISEAAIKLKFSKGMNIKEMKKGMEFSIVGQIKEGDRMVKVRRFFFVHDVFSNGYSYLSLANTFAYHKVLIEQLPNEEEVDKRVKEISRGDMSEEDYITKQSFRKGNEERSYTPKYTKSKNILDILKIGATVKLKTTDNDRNIQEEVIKIENVYWISMSEGNAQVPYNNPKVSSETLSKLRLGNLKKTDVKNFVDASNVGDGMSISR